MKTTLLMTAILVPVLAGAEERSPLDAFPEPAEGQVRIVIPLPEMSRPDDNYAVELVVGRVIQTDGVNQVRMDTALNPRPLEGWGYTYYEMTGSGQVASTLMAPPPGAETVTAFVHGTPLNVRYNAKLPIVIYLPAGFEARYRIWAAAADYLTGQEG